MRGFNSNILKIIKEFEYEFFVIQQDFSVRCVCVNHDTKQADPNCPKCLSTGYKIKIVKVKGACQNSNVPDAQRASQGVSIAKNYYIKSKKQIFSKNIIVDKDEVYNINRVTRYTSFKGEDVYQKCLSMNKKLDSKTLLNNFNKIIEGKL